MKTQLKPEDIKAGKTYKAKRRRDWLGFTNDRYVTWISSDRSQVQYDSDTVPNGRRYPKVSMEQFLKWAKEELIDG